MYCQENLKPTKSLIKLKFFIMEAKLKLKINMNYYFAAYEHILRTSSNKPTHDIFLYFLDFEN